MNTKKLLNNVNVLGVTEMTFLTKRAMFHSLKQKGIRIQVTFTFKKLLNVITLYNYIYIYYTYKYVSYTYFTVYVEVFVCFEIFLLTSGVSLFVRGAPVMLFIR